MNVRAEDRRPAQETMKSRKPKIGGRYVARMRGAFSWARVAAPSAGKPRTNLADIDACVANVGATGGPSGGSATRTSGPDFVRLAAG